MIAHAREHTRPLLPATLIAVIVLIAALAIAAPAPVSAAPLPSGSTGYAHQEGPAQQAEETPDIFAPENEDDTRETTLITMGIVSLVGITLLGIGIGIFGFLQD